MPLPLRSLHVTAMTYAYSHPKAGLACVILAACILVLQK